jgi:D-cysteine desulfhydrase
MGLHLPERLELAHTPTPIQPLERLSNELGVRLRVKRDDLTGSHLSGNKIRKLEFLLADAKAQKATHVITCGGIQSNHCRATAMAARPLGMEAVLLLRTEHGLDSDLPDPPTGNVFLDKLVQAQLVPCTREGYQARAEKMAQLAHEIDQDGGHAVIIPEGGSNALGSLGYVRAAQEITRQLGDDLPETVVVPTGSGGTVAGLAIGFLALGVHTRVVGIPVCDDSAHFRDVSMAIGAEAHSRFGTPKLSPDTIDFIDGFQGQGYALTTPEELSFLREIATHDGLVLDPVYTNKSFRGMIETCRSGSGRMGQDILFIHTGGIFGLMGQNEAFRPLMSS